MSLRLKFGLAMGCVLLLTIFVACVSMFGIHRALKHQEQLYIFSSTLEKQFQTIVREQQAFFTKRNIRHSRNVTNLIVKIRKNVNIVLTTIKDEKEKDSVTYVLDALKEYENNFREAVQAVIDMETMQSRMFHESKRLITNADEIDRVSGRGMEILKAINETILAEKNYIVTGKKQNAADVNSNVDTIITLANEIRNGRDPAIQLYGFRISKIAGGYRSVFQKFVRFENIYLLSRADMINAFKYFKKELEQYISIVTQKQKRNVTFLYNLLFFCSISAILLGTITTFLLSKLITAPINDLKDSAARIMEGNLDERVKVYSDDEIGQLARIFNEMTERLEKSFNSLEQYKNHLEELVQERTHEKDLEIENHKLTQAALKEEKDRALKYFDITGSVLVVIGKDQKVKMINEAGSKLIGRGKKEIVGKNWFDHFIPDEDRDDTKEVFDRIIKGELEPVEFYKNKIVTKKGKQRVISWHNNVLRDNDGKVLATLSAGEDITRVIQMEQDRKQLQERLQQARKMEAIGTLAGGIAHDFNNILHPVIGYAEMSMLDLPEDTPVRENLDNILSGALRAKELVNQILAFSRQKEMTIKPIHIKPIVKEALKLLRSTIPKNIAIQQEISESKIVVKADPTEIYEIIMNLCTNAYHAMESSGGCLGVNINAASLNFMDQNQLDLLPCRYCILTVSDTAV